MITGEKNIIKELDVKEGTFNLKSQSTGKYSVHDSYRDNYKNGFLIKINAPEDVKNALKDIYYATERGLIISYKEFNNKIASIRKKLLAESYPNKDIKELSNDDRIRIEMNSAKQVLKDLAINESTKLIYSPELTKLNEEYINENYKLKFIPDEIKVVFQEPEDSEKAQLVKMYLEFSDKIKKMSEISVDSNNLDDIELTIIDISNLYDNLPDLAKENADIKNFYNEQLEKLKNTADKIKQRQVDYENLMNSTVKNIVDNKQFKDIKSTINEIETNFNNNLELKYDTKTKSIKEFAVNQLKNIGKVVALNSLGQWSDKNFEVAEKLFSEPLDLDLLESLRDKFNEQDSKRREEKEKLEQVDIDNSSAVYEKLKQLTEQKDLFIKLFEKIKENNSLNSLLEKSDDAQEFIILLSNNLDYDSVKELYATLSEKVKEIVLQTNFHYQSIIQPKIRDLYFLLVAKEAVNDVVENIFGKMDSSYIKMIGENTLAKIVTRISTFTYKPDEILKKTNINKLFALLETEDCKNNDYLKNAVVRVLIKWVTKLKTNSEELNKILVSFPEFAIYEITKRQLRETDNKIILQITDNNQENKELLAEIAKKIGQEKIDSIVKTKLENLIEEDPNNFDNQYNSALNNLNHKKYDEAIKGFKKCTSINPESHLAQYMLAYCYEAKGQHDIAVSYYKKATQLKYNYTDAYYGLGMLYTKMNDHFLAIQQFKKILKTEPAHYDACVALGVAYDEMGEPDQALEYYEKAILIDSEKADAYINKAIILTLKGEAEQAIEVYNDAVERAPKNSKIQYNLGVLYHQKKDYSAAIAHYKLAIKFDKNNSMAYNNLGLAYFSKVRVNDAIEVWEKAIELDSKNVEAYNNLAWGYNVRGELDKAIDTYKKAQKIDPRHAVLYMNLGTVYYKNNQLDKAIKELEMFLEMDPNSDNAYEIIKILKSLRNQLKSANLPNS